MRCVGAISSDGSKAILTPSFKKNASERQRQTVYHCITLLSLQSKILYKVIVKHLSWGVSEVKQTTSHCAMSARQVDWNLRSVILWWRSPVLPVLLENKGKVCRTTNSWHQQIAQTLIIDNQGLLQLGGNRKSEGQKMAERSLTWRSSVEDHFFIWTVVLKMVKHLAGPDQLNAEHVKSDPLSWL